MGGGDETHKLVVDTKPARLYSVVTVKGKCSSCGSTLQAAQGQTCLAFTTLQMGRRWRGTCKNVNELRLGFSNTTRNPEGIKHRGRAE
jgi:hypothetical protein